MTVLVLVGCNNEIINSHIDKAIQLQPDQPNSITSSPTSIRFGNSSNLVKTYEDETYKNIKFENLSFNIGSYHVVSDTS